MKFLLSVKFGLKIFILYWILVAFGMGMLGFMGYGLILPCYKPDFFNFYVFTLLNNFIFFLGPPIVIGSDFFFFNNVLLLKTQFKILNKCISSLDLGGIKTRSEEEVVMRKMKIYIRHHNFLLKYS